MPDDLKVLDNLTEEEAYLFAILSDPSGLDQAEFLWVDQSSEDNIKTIDGERTEVRPAPSGCFRAWSFQWAWWRDSSPLSIDQCARSVGKSLSIKVRACAFPFLFPGQEMIITAPELVHLEPVVSLIESQMYQTRTLRELLPPGRSAVTHRPFQMNFLNGSRLIGRIPQRDGKGVKGCVAEDTPILTDEGYKAAGSIEEGDRVYTHTGRFAPVLAVEYDVNDCYTVHGLSSFDLTVSCDHRFLGAERPNPDVRKNWPATWHDVEYLIDHHVDWATPEVFPPLPIPELLNGEVPLRWPLQRWWDVGRYIATDDPSVAGDDPFLLDWLTNEIGFGRPCVPVWALGMPEGARRALFDGIVDHFHYNEGKHRWETTSVSRPRMLTIQLLAQSLGYVVTVTVQRGYPRVHIMDGYRPSRTGSKTMRYAKVKSVRPAGKQRVVNIITDDHSYLTGSIVSHNIHPIRLELDEAQDYPHAGWVELNETLKRGWSGAMWRAHGVTRGVRDDFYAYTQDTPDNPWKVHRFAAMWRPTWTDQEREEAIQKYGSREDPDYRRNVLGLHGDRTNPLFVLTQLMKNVDIEPLSDYNANEYFKALVKSEQLELFEQDIVDVLDFPAGHRSYSRPGKSRTKSQQARYWAGMDVGFTVDPSEILVFVEHRPKPSDDLTVLKLLTRISMARMPHRQQIHSILHVIDFYHPTAFAMDKGGVGLPLFQELAEHIEAYRKRDYDKLPPWMRAYDLEAALTTIKGYHFGEKLVVDLDPSVEIGPHDDTEAIVAKSGMRRNAKEHATDVLRELVDSQRLLLPWDDDLLKQFQGGTWTSNRQMDQYGRRTFSSGNDHVLDAARMVALAWSLATLEEMTKPPPDEPVYDAFLSM